MSTAKKTNHPPHAHDHACTAEPHECTGECEDRAGNCPDCAGACAECAGGSCSCDEDHGDDAEHNHEGGCPHCSELRAQLERAQDKERRALADYQNLVRRTQTDTAKFAKFATRELVTQLIQPLEHLRLAAQQVKDPGLELVITQLWHVLEQNGVTVIDPLGQEFSVETMEAVDQTGDGTHVTQVVTRGYLLNGDVLQHAKVLVGSKN